MSDYLIYICVMTGKKITSLIKSKGLKMVFIANGIRVNKTDLSLALSGKRNTPRTKEILLLVAKFIKNK